MNNILSLISVITPLSFFLIGCSSGFPGARPLDYTTSGEMRQFVSSDTCPHSIENNTNEDVLLAAVGLAIGKQVLTNFGSVLAKGAAGGPLSPSTAITNMTPDPGVIPKCIVIIRGEFDNDEKNESDKNLKAYFSAPAEDNNTFNLKLTKFNIPKLSRIDYLIEISIIMSGNLKAFKMVPVYLKFDHSIDGDSSGKRDITIAFDFTTPDGNKTGSVVTIQNASLGAPPKTFKNYSHESPWFNSFNAVKNEQANKRLMNNGTVSTGSDKIYQSTGNLFSNASDSMPITFTSSVVETRHTKQGLLFISSVFNTVKPDVETYLNNTFDPATIKNNKIESSSALSIYLVAIGNAKKAILDYCSLSENDNSKSAREDRIIKSSAAGVAQVEANSAALRMGQSYEYTKIIPISDKLNNKQQYCN